MKWLSKFTVISLLVSSSFATDYLIEDFSSKEQFSTNVPFFSDSNTSSGYDFFGISNGDNTGDFGLADASKTKVKKYTGFSTNFLTGMDLDGEGASLPIIVEWKNINISGSNKLYFSGKFAEFIDSKLKIDADDFIKVEVKVDENPWKTLFKFQGDKQYNGYFDLNGIKLGTKAQTLQASLPESGDLLNLRLSISVNSGDEDFAISNIKISDKAIANCGGTQIGKPASCDSSSLPDDTQTLKVSIHEIQGKGKFSPIIDKKVQTKGIVTALMPNLKGFYLQETDENIDSNDKTSEGVFVYYGSTNYDVKVGDKVQLDAEVAEFYDNTQLKSIENLKVISSNNSLPSAKIINLPIENLENWEALEGMRVKLPQTLTVTDTYKLGRYGELLLSAKGRIFQYTHENEPSTQGYEAYKKDFVKNTIILEDGSTKENPQTIIFPSPSLSNENILRAGDTTTDLEGVVSYSFGNYKIIPTKNVNFSSENPRPALEYVNGNLKVASFNVLNLFVSIDDKTKKCGANKNMDCRGADSQEELERQTKKLVNTLAKMDADIVGLNELENTKDVKVLKYLVDALNNKVGAETYNYVDTGLIGDDAIKVGIIYKNSSVKAVNNFAILNSKIDETFNDSKNRPSLAQTFEEKSTGEKFTIIVNHLKSKGSPCDDVNDPDKTDGQDSCAETRTKAVIALSNWIKTDPTKSKDKDFLILGDFNSYAKENPIATFENKGYVNLIDKYLGNKAYSFSYSGQWGYLDYAFANKNLLNQVTGLTEWHINSDEAAAFDYNDYNQENLYKEHEFRVSDHDPLIVGLTLSSSNDDGDNPDNGDGDNPNDPDNPDDGNPDNPDNENPDNPDNENPDNPDNENPFQKIFEQVVKVVVKFLDFLSSLFSFFSKLF